MERIKALIARFGRMIFLFFIGIILIIYVALGILYLQQGPQQRSYNEQISKLNIILRVPLPSADPLNAEYQATTDKLAPFSDAEAIAMLVNLAKASGIDIFEGANKFQIPIPLHSSAGVGGGSYQTLVFRGIYIQGDHDKVTAFVSALDSGVRLENMVLTNLITDEIEVIPIGADGERRAEFRLVIQAVKDMMGDNGLVLIPNALSARLGKATNRMGDEPDTVGIVEGFPDNKTATADKGYTGNATPRGGYLLYQHDKIQSDNTTLFSTLDYFPSITTKYYYTAEDEGTVRQWSGPNLAVATEYPDSGPTKMEMRATLDVVIYFKPK